MKNRITQNGVHHNTTLDIWTGLLLQWNIFSALFEFWFFGRWLSFFLWTISYRTPQIKIKLSVKIVETSKQKSFKNDKYIDKAVQWWGFLRYDQEQRCKDTFFQLFWVYYCVCYGSGGIGSMSRPVWIGEKKNGASKGLPLCPKG